MLNWTQHWLLGHTTRLCATGHHLLCPTDEPGFNLPHVCLSSSAASLWGSYGRMYEKPYWGLGRQYPLFSLPLQIQSFHHKRLPIWSTITPLVNPCWLVLVILFPFLCLGMVSRIILYITFSGTEVRLTSSCFFFGGGSFFCSCSR